MKGNLIKYFFFPFLLLVGGIFTGSYALVKENALVKEFHLNEAKQSHVTPAVLAKADSEVLHHAFHLIEDVNNFIPKFSAILIEVPHVNTFRGYLDLATSIKKRNSNHHFNLNSPLYLLFSVFRL